MVKGTFFIGNLWENILIDSGASHSFIALSFVSALGLETEELHPSLAVETLVGVRVRLDRICHRCNLTILDRTFIFYFIVLDITGFNLVLRID